MSTTAITTDQLSSQEREAREQAEADVRAKQAAEEAKRKAEATAARKATAASDKAKLLAYAESLSAQPRPVMGSQASNWALGEIESELSNLLTYIRRQAESL